jgi:hypothetical protein
LFYADPGMQLFYRPWPEIPVDKIKPLCIMDKSLLNCKGTYRRYFYGKGKVRKV